jgi:pyruvate/2-oxoglutarate dehydrogenase complex dihydrolipoamide dehydrogenase (E3) component
MIGKKFDYDLVVIGSGRSGREGAVKAALAGQRVAIVEAGLWGGEEVNYSGIPFETLLEVSRHLTAVTADPVISSETLRLRYDGLLRRAEEARQTAAKDTLAEIHNVGVKVIEGFAQFVSPHEINVDKRTIAAKHFLIATGRGLKENRITGVEEAGCLDVTGVVELERMPRTVFVVGAGATGCEVAQYFSGIGARVLIADIAGRLLPDEDEEVGQLLDAVFNRQRIAVLTQTRVTAVERDHVSRRVVFTRDGVEHAVRVDEVVIATGTLPETHDLRLEKAGVEYGRKGIRADSEGKTSQKHIATTVAPKMRRVRTLPEVITFGHNEDECLQSDERVKCVVEPLSSEGFVKTVTDARGALVGLTLMGTPEEMFEWLLANRKEPVVQALLIDGVA